MLLTYLSMSLVDPHCARDLFLLFNCFELEPCCFPLKSGILSGHDFDNIRLLFFFLLKIINHLLKSGGFGLCKLPVNTKRVKFLVQIL